mmetsp:Transcript_17236/g.26665  ORF Transcript_17236/g.26665 Transcript_17236/m.26665 type:complete len:124 (-) Transcript_17236:111-482(-)|eukprot:CAMPEP_0184313564 /NCGR_PEP_ID=MMETSP1049-20130417/64972_1 /TAXON_ID=77928 /ORGANISM="Proteomonas sulcata, Strain CCMP704" /LENGTH=123 /DNA_ID=CAMNT_0026630909 /DNA_START=265 /DNA_END=636 /DNA_ORIENTATION=+
MASAGLQQRLETEVKSFQALQKEHQKQGQMYSKLLSQQNENSMVLSEMKILQDEAKVYKLVGPVLLSQDLEEAKSNVEKRLQYIGDEMKRNQNRISDLESQMEEKKKKVMQLQSQAQAKAQGK